MSVLLTRLYQERGNGLRRGPKVRPLQLNDIDAMRGLGKLHSESLAKKYGCSAKLFRKQYGVGLALQLERCKTPEAVRLILGTSMKCLSGGAE